MIDLKASPPKVAQQVQAGKGPNEVSVSPDGTLALVANRAEGSVSIFKVADKRLEPAGKLDLANPKSFPSSLKFLPDGKSALLTRYGDNSIAVLDIDGTSVKLNERKVVTGLSPYTMDVSHDGKLAAVGHMAGGGNGGDIDTVSLIDVSKRPFVAVETVAVPSSPEGLKFSPDGKFLAVGSIDHSTRAKENPFFHDHGKLWILAVQDKHLKPVAEAPIGRWSQGIAFSKDGRTILVESMIDHGMNVFRWEDGKLVPTGTLDLHGAPAAIRTSWP